MAAPHSAYRYLFSTPFLKQFFNGDAVTFQLEGNFYAIPAESLSNPVSLARMSSTHQRIAQSRPEMWRQEPRPSLSHTTGDALSEGLVACWQELLKAEQLSTGSRPSGDGPKLFPPLLETALLVHLLGLEPHSACVLSQATDDFLVREVAPQMMREPHQLNAYSSECVAALVNVIAKALRPWPFQAPPLTTYQRVILCYLLSDLATAKSKKLLHEEKKHTHRRELPQVINNAVNRALKRWHRRGLQLSPAQLLLRAAAMFRYVRNIRQGVTPDELDTAVVIDCVERAH